MRFSYSILLTLLSILPCAAQPASLATPELGFVFDTELGSIRPIRGIPGAALLGNPIHTGFPIVRAAIAPRQQFTIVTADNLEPRLVRFQNGAATVALLPGAMPSPERVV